MTRYQEAGYARGFRDAGRMTDLTHHSEALRIMVEMPGVEDTPMGATERADWLRGYANGILEALGPEGETVPCQQCGGPNDTSGTVCQRCALELLSGATRGTLQQLAVAFARRCEQCGNPLDIAGRWCTRCLHDREAG